MNTMMIATVGKSDFIPRANTLNGKLEVTVEKLIDGRKINMRLVFFSQIVVCFNLGVNASAAQDELKARVEFEKQGEFFRAAMPYSRVLRVKQGDKKARRALERIADYAIEEKLLNAERAEAEGMWSQASGILCFDLCTSGIQLGFRCEHVGGTTKAPAGRVSIAGPRWSIPVSSTSEFEPVRRFDM